ncbi:MAG TPA: hypothetical protein PLJ16_14090 [Casimicrobium huifangae]|nr:hypothetical protein [Casimicrobium huifangae]HQD66357.1 hypothetical protein [Casimicrobium huifangae]
MSESDPMYAAWRDLVLSAGGLAAIFWIVDAPVAALGMMALAVFGRLVMRVAG